MSWHVIDLGPDGPAGIEVKFRLSGEIIYAYAEGSNHPWDWAHHFLPFARRREIRAGRKIAELLYDPAIDNYILGGHSLGGCVMEIAGCFLTARGVDVEVSSYGGKRAPRPYTNLQAFRWRRRGDIVPYLPPWRKGQYQFEFGDKLSMRKAHHPRSYAELREKHGFR